MGDYLRWAWEWCELRKARRELNEHGVRPSEPVALKPRRDSLVERMWSLRGKHS
jgi:hypothetical protein